MINKVAMIAVVGRPNVGKSTLTNVLTGDKVAIVTPKPQTTRNRIFGVFTYNDTQMILLDTPGFHKARTRLGDYMVGVVKESVADVDAVALIIEPVDNIGTQEELLIEHIEKSGVPAILVINKIDTVKAEQLLPIIKTYSQRYAFDAIIPISAKKSDGISGLLEIFEKYAKQGQQLFPDGMSTDQPEKQMIAEIIREKLLICLESEIPHGTAVEITKFSERGEGNSEFGIRNEGNSEFGIRNEGNSEFGIRNDENSEFGIMNSELSGLEDSGISSMSVEFGVKNGELLDKAIGAVIIDIDATIYCEKASHKGMIIGKNGAMLKRIGQLAREDIEKFMGAKVFLQTWVKVKENWRDNQTMIRNFGYTQCM